MDSHETHHTLGAVLYKEQTGTILLTFPSYCSYHLKSLYVAVFGPFKSRLAPCQSDWLVNHTGKTVCVAHLNDITKEHVNLSFTRKNILARFETPDPSPQPINY
jgi:hypothetical protein